MSSGPPMNTSLPAGGGLKLNRGSLTEYWTGVEVSASSAETIPSVVLTVAFSAIVKSARKRIKNQRELTGTTMNRHCVGETAKINLQADCNITY